MAKCKYSEKYLILKDKKPYPNFSTYHPYSQLTTVNEIGVLIEYPFIVIDIDLKNNDIDRVEQVLDILEDSGLNFGFMETAGGYHLWFKSEVPLLNRNKEKTFIGLNVDIKSWGKKSQARIRKDGVDLHWYNQPEISELDYLPSILKGINGIEIDDWFTGVTRGERHEIFLRNIYPLASVGFTPQDIYDAYKFINRFVIESPLDITDIQAMTLYNDKLKDASFYRKSNTSNAVILDTNAVALAIQKQNRLHIDEEGVVWIYNEQLKYYIVDPQHILTQIHKLMPYITNNARLEVLSKISLNLRLNGTTIRSLGKHQLVCKNGILNLEDGTLEPLDDRVFNTKILPHNYNRRVKRHPDVDRVFKNITLGNKELELLLYQMIGYAMCNHSDYTKAFILLGEGNNGKSVFLEALIALFGFKNKSSVTLNGLKDPTKVSQLINKFVNLVDEIGKKIDETESFKAIASGMPVPAKFLYKDIFDIRLFTKLIFNANELPSTKDKTKGFFRRWIIIPFRATFSETDPDFDPEIQSKITTEDALEYIFFKAVEAYQILVQDKHFIKVSDVNDLIEGYRSDLDSLYAWLASLKEDELEGVEINKSFEIYQFWANVNGYSRPVEFKAFKRDLPVKSDYVAKNTTRQGVQIYVWRHQK